MPRLRPSAVPPLRPGDGYGVADLAFFADEWGSRNAIMADNIERIAREYPGMRIVFLCGAEHRYILRRLLQDRAGIVVREYYEV